MPYMTATISSIGKAAWPSRSRRAAGAGLRTVVTVSATAGRLDQHRSRHRAPDHLESFAGEHDVALGRFADAGHEQHGVGFRDERGDAQIVRHGAAVDDDKVKPPPCL